MTTRALLLAICASAFASMSGCTSQQIYESGTMITIPKCEQIPDAVQREECLTFARMSYKDYQELKKESAR